MKKMVPHDLMRVQITKILVYFFLPALTLCSLQTAGLVASFYSLQSRSLSNWPPSSYSQVHFKVLLQPFHREGMKARYELSMSVNSTNPENKNSVSDNIKNINIPIQVDTDLILKGLVDSL